MSEYKNPAKIPMTQKILLGMVGERIVAQFLRSQGREVIESLNVFDSEKDMMVDGKPCEVKTQVPFMIEDSFALPVNQLKKVMGVHRLYFVCVPLKRPDDLAGGIFEIDLNSDHKSHHRTLAGTKEIICFPRRQPAMKKIAQINDPAILNQLRTLSTSYL